MIAAVSCGFVKSNPDSEEEIVRNRVASLTAGLVATRGSVSRTRRYVGFLTVCLAVLVGVLAGQTQVARASITCPTQGFSFSNGGGYFTSGTPAVGSAVNAHLALVGSSVTSGSNNGYLGVTIGGNGVFDNLRIGIDYPDPANDGEGELYFYTDGDIRNIMEVPRGTTEYHVWITHDSSNQYSLHYSGTTAKSFATFNAGPSNQTYMLASTTSTFDHFTYLFDGLVFPYDTSMVACQDGNYPPVANGSSEFAVASPS